MLEKLEIMSVVDFMFLDFFLIRDFINSVFNKYVLGKMRVVFVYAATFIKRIDDERA